MLLEAPDELVFAKGHQLTLVVAVVPVPESDLVMINRADPVVGDGRTVGIAPKIADHLLRSAKRSFGIDLPLFLSGGINRLINLFAVCGYVLPSLTNQPEENSLVDLFHCRRGKQELSIVSFGLYPLSVFDATTTDNAMQVHMVIECLPP